jgi:hypothetical protein
MKKFCTLFFVIFVLFFSVRSAFAQDTTWFKNVTGQVGLNDVKTFYLMVCDVNNDDYPDLMVVRSGDIYSKDAMRIYINVQDTNSLDPLDRIFLDVTPISGINANVNPDSVGHRVINAVFADVNNDGNVDMITGNDTYNLETYYDNGDRGEVLLGDGTGKFTTLPNNGIHEIGLNNPTGHSFLDYDKDGNLDVFMGTFFLDYAGNVWNHAYLFKGNGDGTFTDVTTASGIDTKLEPLYGCQVTDWNNDGWPDILTSPYCRTSGTLWKNNGDGTFTDVSTSAGYNTRFMQGDNGQTLCNWTAAPEDFDNDGDIDLMLALVHGGNDANEGHSTIVINEGADSSYHLHWELNRVTWDAPKSTHHGDYDISWFDFDNDGLEDMSLMQGHYMPATDRLYMFQQNPNNTFTDVTSELGFIGGPEDTIYKSTHATEPIDYDLDGDDDLIYSKDAVMYTYLLRNEVGNLNNWVSVKLIAPPGCNYNSIGARIYVYADSLVKMREVYAGRGNKCGQQPFIMVFGLGNHTAIDSIVVHWPDSAFTVTTVINPPINQMDSIDVNGYASIPENNNGTPENIKLYPNPAHDQFVLQGKNGYSMQNIAAIEIYDITGKKITNFNYYNNNGCIAVVNISKLNTGMYFTRILTKSGCVISKQFVKM